MAQLPWVTHTLISNSSLTCLQEEAQITSLVFQDKKKKNSQAWNFSAISRCLSPRGPDKRTVGENKHAERTGRCICLHHFSSYLIPNPLSFEDEWFSFSTAGLSQQGVPRLLFITLLQSCFTPQVLAQMRSVLMVLPENPVFVFVPLTEDWVPFSSNVSWVKMQLSTPVWLSLLPVMPGSVPCS